MSLETHYPSSCPFCRICNAYPASTPSPVPINPDATQVDPQCHLILSTPHVLAFLDIMPISPGHVLLITRDHHEKLSDVPLGPTADALGLWMPLMARALAKSLDIEDWNVIQNNGARAAQVVPHVHFHFVPRYKEGRKEISGKGHVDMGMLKSWRMFGRGTREDLDDAEAVLLAANIREGLRKEYDATYTDRLKL
ncbi:hypothetical protein AAFC00_005496 [Neodothiora populina]|uniref:HIT domain-containing protein n=1 Tax=Neodothiora populina TaxID=2781224 RepID=A0ABR3PL20_9PEZI